MIRGKARCKKLNFFLYLPLYDLSPVLVVERERERESDKETKEETKEMTFTYYDTVQVD